MWNEPLDNLRIGESNREMKNTKQCALAREMLVFLEGSPLTPDLQWTKDWDFLYHFEAERHLIVCEMLTKAGIHPDQPLNVLDFGFLHGLTQEFLHRAYPKSQTTVYDIPSSPIFGDKDYLEAINKRGYMRLLPGSIDEIGSDAARYDVIILGEIIEHLDPTQVARAFANLKKVASSKCLLVITTPNAAGLYNCWMTLKQRAPIQAPPIPDKTFGYGHIHLWSLDLVRQTAEHYGWTFLDAQFYHGREGEMFEEVRSAWVGISAQINVRLLKLLASKYPKFRGFFVAAFTVKDSPSQD
jgi:2-polyprenyl-3-methyl-5-hydroxy-6-metoxy-1,4-benzoquinol methylase